MFEPAKPATVTYRCGPHESPPRYLFKPGWEATVRVRYDANVFTPAEVEQLMDRAGIQFGIGEGRPGSKNSGGTGWGTFERVQLID